MPSRTVSRGRDRTESGLGLVVSRAGFLRRPEAKERMLPRTPSAIFRKGFVEIIFAKIILKKHRTSTSAFFFLFVFREGGAGYEPWHSLVLTAEEDTKESRIGKVKRKDGESRIERRWSRAGRVAEIFGATAAKWQRPDSPS